MVYRQRLTNYRSRSSSDWPCYWIFRRQFERRVENRHHWCDDIRGGKAGGNPLQQITGWRRFQKKIVMHNTAQKQLI